MKHVIILLLTFIITNSIFSQTGPGGVGTTDGMSSLVLWLDANTITGTPGTTITTWVDGSGNGYDFNFGNGAVYNNPAVNGYPAFNFNGSSHYFERAYTAAINPSNFTIFTTNKVASNSTYKSLITSRSNSPTQKGYILYSLPTNNHWQFWTGGAGWESTPNPSTTSTVGSWSGQSFDFLDATNAVHLFIDGNLNGSNTHSYSPNTTTPCRIGAGATEGSASFHFKGEIGEVILFNTVINSAQKTIINNYLAAKYNYPLGTNDLYSQDNTANGNYDHDVAGIGRVDASNLHNDAQGTGIVRILNPTGLGDDEFLIWGHNNALQQANETTDIPSPVVARFTRVWRVNEVNSASNAVDVGAIDIRFDLTGLGAITPSDLRLLVDTDNDGVFSDETPISGVVSLGNDIYQFTGVTTISNNVRFTLGTINKTQTSLPIELLNFSATPINNESVSLEWQTVSEFNNDYFTIQRSKDGVNWQEISKVDGAGNASSLLSYFTADKHPYMGVSYYRLKQTDFNGEFEYSKISLVNIIDENNLKIFPNPANNQITILGKQAKLKEITIHNALGQDVTALTKKNVKNDAHLVIDLSKLNPGVYYIKTKTTTSIIHKQ